MIPIIMITSLVIAVQLSVCVHVHTHKQYVLYANNVLSSSASLVLMYKTYQ